MVDRVNFPARIVGGDAVSRRADGRCDRIDASAPRDTKALSGHPAKEFEVTRLVAT
jgi:hypothetical protein